MEINHLFPNIIGQDGPKRKIAFFLENEVFPNSIFIAPRGSGKTTLAKALASNLKFQGAVKPFIEINCSTLNNIWQLTTQIIGPMVEGKAVTILFDEASEIPRDITMALLTILNPNPERKTQFIHDDRAFEFDFRKQTFLFCTTEGQQVFHALMDRLERFELEAYTPGQLAAIVEIAVGTRQPDEILLEIAATLRGSARSAQKMGEHVRGYLEGVRRPTLNSQDWQKIRTSLGILPLGILPIELQILRILEKRAQMGKGCTLTQLSCMTDMTAESLRRDLERFLLKNGLIEIAPGKGRCLTGKGQRYLRDL